MQTSSNSLIIILAMTLNVIFILLVETTDFANAQPSGKMTLTCTRGGNCITVICIDDRPCDAMQLNSKNSTGLRDFLENKTRTALIPNEIV
jgi:hypothetical protein